MIRWMTMVLLAAALLLAGCDNKAKEGAKDDKKAPQAKGADTSGEKPAEKPVEKATEKAGDKAAEQASDKPAEKPADTPKAGAGDTPSGAMLVVDPGAKDPAPVSRAIAVMQPTKGNEAHGVITFEQTDEGVKITADLHKMPASGKNAFHIHVYGDCSGDDGKTAGTHFHFTGSALNPPEDIKIITGNLGDLAPDDKGDAKAEAIIKDASLQGAFTILGRSVIIHEKPNDPSAPPIGAAGGRISCGVVGIAK